MIIAANWKMHLNHATGISLVEALNKRAASWSDIQVVICPPAPYLSAVRQNAHPDFYVGGQTCHSQKLGAHTGHVSADMIVDCGAQYVIIGHSERRQSDGETGEVLAEQAKMAIKSGLKIIFCVGETLEERQAGRAEMVVSQQLASLDVFLKAGSVPVIAYEPVWAIGTGQVASVPDINAMHDFIKSETRRLIGNELVPQILYGGSVKPNNAEAILSIASVDGALVGGASLDAAGFAAICDIAQQVSC